MNELAKKFIPHARAAAPVVDSGSVQELQAGKGRCGCWEFEAQRGGKGW